MNIIHLPRPRTTPEHRLVRALLKAHQPDWLGLLGRKAAEVLSLRPKISPLPEEPKHPTLVGTKEWLDRVHALGTDIPTCKDRFELALPEAGPTKCMRTGLILKTGRCAACNCKRAAQRKE